MSRGRNSLQFTMFLNCSLDKSTNATRSLKEIPESLTVLLECPAPPKNPKSPTHPTFNLFKETKLPIIVNKDDFAWLLARTHTLYSSSTTEETATNVSERSHVPGWSGTNSLVNKVRHIIIHKIT